MAEDMMHTPGPWEVRGPRVGHTHTMRFGRFCTIATVGGHVKNTANARLIAAAPEQNAALAMIAEKLPIMPDPDAGPDDEIEVALTWREVSQIKHALARAHFFRRAAGG